MKAVRPFLGVIAVVSCLTGCTSDLHSSVAKWNGDITITLPGRLRSAPDGSASCAGRPGTEWSDVKTGASVAMRNGAGRVLATWTLPEGVALPAHGDGKTGGCQYTLTQSDGIDSGFDRYALRIASHVLAVPADHIGGNLFIELPRRQYTKPIKDSHSD